MIPHQQDWLYLKIYGGWKSLEKWLVMQYFPDMMALSSENLVLRWFFIRYRDPESHLRVRILRGDGVDEDLIMERIEATLYPYQADHRIWKVVFMPYRPEIKLYGFSNISTFEKLFHIDSEWVLEVLADRRLDDLEKRLLLFASVDDLVGHFFSEWSDRVRYYREVSERYRREFGYDGQRKINIDNKFREVRQDMSLFLSGQGLDDLRPRMIQSNVSLIHEIRNIRSRRGWWKDPMEILIRLIHLRINRLFPDHQRLVEWITMELLFRYYRSAIARNDIKNSLHEKDQISTPV